MNEIELARTYLQTLLEIERAPQAQLDAYQQDLLASLYRHATRNVPFYRDYPELVDAPDPASQEWRTLPLVSRRDLMRHANSITTRSMPQSHGMIAPVQTGGSTGTPVRVALSTLESVARIACTYRMFLAWKLDVSRSLFMIRRPQIGSNGVTLPAFGGGAFLGFRKARLGRVYIWTLPHRQPINWRHCQQSSGLRQYAAV